MSFLEWKDEYCVEDEKIDEQHKELVELLNSLHEGMKGQLLDEAMSSMLDKVVEHTRRHFATEEQAMRKHHYPGLETHRRAHRALTQQIAGLQKRQKEGRLPISHEVLLFLREWLVGHMKEMDREFGVYLAGEHKRDNPTPRAEGSDVA